MEGITRARVRGWWCECAVRSRAMIITKAERFMQRRAPTRAGEKKVVIVKGGKKKKPPVSVAAKKKRKKSVVFFSQRGATILGCIMAIPAREDVAASPSPCNRSVISPGSTSLVGMFLSRNTMGNDLSLLCSFGFLTVLDEQKPGCLDSTTRRRFLFLRFVRPP